MIRPLLRGWAQYVNALDTRRTGLRRVHKRVPCPVLPAGQSLKVAFFSDLHAGPTTSERVLALVGDAVASWQPDLLLLGGDYVFTRPEYATRLVPLLRRCRGAIGTFAVWGNHDLHEGTAKIAPILSAAGVHILHDNAVRLAPHERIIIAGTDDCGRGEPNLNRTLADARSGDFVLLLTHNPDIIARPFPRDLERPALILAGHTHGGGACLPGGRPLVHPSDHGFVAGDYDTDWGPLHVSRGVGCVELPLRILAPPEVLLLTLQA